MSTSSRNSLLTEQISVLVRHFGIERVRKAVAKVPHEDGEELPRPARKNGARSQGRIRPNGISNAIESIRETHPEKHRLLSEFITRLKGRQVLPESQDIRQFAQIIGLKEIGGKSREDMLPKLIRFLADRPIDQLRTDIEDAGNISERQRQMGFSVLTEKLLGRS
jgi:hypothetical protein